jgi:hypothetical protein
MDSGASPIKHNSEQYDGNHRNGGWDGEFRLAQGLCNHRGGRSAGRELLLEMRQDGKAAESEFDKITSNRGIVGNFLLGALAHLGLGRAYTLTNATAKAKSAYQDFLALWKDADPDIPILKQAKAEYAKLQ